MNWKRKPNFFIVGAPKCGTTAMYYYLLEHPDIFGPAKKELHQFGSDLKFPHNRTELDYQAFFHDWADEKVGGDASVWYLYSKLAAQEIREFNPDAKIIIMVRNPADMVHAQHSQAMFVGRETIVSFEDALQAELGRQSGEIPTHPLSPKQVFYYSKIARYTEQIKRFVKQFGRENVHIVVFDDLEADVEKTYANTLRFLEVDQTFKADFRPRNKNRRYKNKSLHYLVNNPPPWFKRAVTTMIPTGLWRRAKSRLQKINTTRSPREPMKAETRQLLNEMYADEVKALSSYLGRDLIHWSDFEPSQSRPAKY